MLSSLARHIRLFLTPTVVICGLTLPGCVSKETHTKTLAELNASKRTAVQQAAELDALKQTLAQETAQRRAAEQQTAALAKEREALSTREQQLNGELGHVRGQLKEVEQKLAAGNASAQDEIAKLQQQASDLEAESARVAKEREELLLEQSQLAAALEQERAAKDAEIARLTRTQEEVSKSLQDEIAKGNISIQQVRDQLTINMVDRVLFDSGQAGELLYYVMFFGGFLLMARMLEAPSWPLAAVTGFWLALSHLTKASVLPGLMLFLVLGLIKVIWTAVRRSRLEAGPAPPAGPRLRRPAGARALLRRKATSGRSCSQIRTRLPIYSAQRREPPGLSPLPFSSGPAIGSRPSGRNFICGARGPAAPQILALENWRGVEQPGSSSGS